MKTKIKGRYVLAYDDSQHRHCLLEDAELVHEDATILYVGSSYNGDVDRVIDATDCMIIPGLINAHGLIDVSIKQFGFEKPREKGYHRPCSWVGSTGDEFGPEEIRRGADLAFLNMLRSGCTTVAGITSMVFKRWDDPEWEPMVYMESAVHSGIRAYLSHHYRARAPYTGLDGEKAFLLDEDRGMRGLERCEAFIRAYDGAFGGRIRGALFPYTLDQSTPNLLRATEVTSRELGVPVRMHTAQSDSEVEFIKAEYGASPVEYLDDLGVINPRWLFTHAMYLGGNHPATSSKDLEVLAARGANIANCPWIYTFRGAFLKSLSEYSRAGINMCIGTDTFPQDMLREMRWAIASDKIANASPEAGIAQQALNAATLNAARWLGREDLGRLAPGARADLAMIDFDRFSIGPVDDPVKNLVYFATAADVRRVIVDGETVVDDHCAVRLDESEVVRKSQPVSEKVGSLLQAWSMHRE